MDIPNLLAWRSSEPSNRSSIQDHLRQRGAWRRALQVALDDVLAARGEGHHDAHLQRTDDNGLTWYGVMDDGETRLED